MGTATLGQGTANGNEVGHEQGGSASRAHGNDGSGLGSAGPAGGVSAGAGRGYWWLTGPGLRHCSRLGVETGDD